MRISDWSSDVCSSDLEGGGDQVLGHFRVGQHARVDAHLAALHPAGERHRDHAAAGVAGDFDVGELFLPALHVFLHLLRLLHQLADVSTHRSEEHTSELQSLMRISYAGVCLYIKTHAHNKHYLEQT